MSTFHYNVKKLINLHIKFIMWTTGLISSFHLDTFWMHLYAYMHVYFYPQQLFSKQWKAKTGKRDCTGQHTLARIKVWVFNKPKVLQFSLYALAVNLANLTGTHSHANRLSVAWILNKFKFIHYKFNINWHEHEFVNFYV